MVEFESFICESSQRVLGPLCQSHTIMTQCVLPAWKCLPSANLLAILGKLLEVCVPL